MNTGSTSPGGQRRDALSRPLNWLALVLAVLGLGGSYALYVRLRAMDERQQRQRTAEELPQLAHQVGDDVVRSIQPLAKFADWWIRQGPPIDVEDWKSDSQLFLDAGTGLEEVRWLDAKLRTRWAVRPGQKPVPGGDAVPAAVAAAIGSQQCASGATIVGRPRGGRLIACTPARRGGHLVGYVIGLYDPARILSSTFSEFRVEYSIKIRGDGTVLYSQGVDRPANDGNRRVVKLPGDEWVLSLVLPPEQFAELRDLITGFAVLITVLLCVSARIAHVARRRSVELARANERVADLNRDLQLRLGEFETLLELAPVGIAVANDAECRAIWTNSTLARMMGVPRSLNISKSGPDAENLPCRMVRNGVEVPTEELPMQTAARTGRDVTGYEMDVIRADGTILNTLSYSSPLFDERGAVRGVLNACVDITEHKRAVAALRASEAALERLISSNVFGMVIASQERILQANEHFLKLTGINRAELEQGQIGWSDVEPAGASQHQSHIRELLAAGHVAPRECELLSRQGKRVPVLIGGAVLEDSPEWKCVCFVLDRSHSRDLERRFRRLEKYKSLVVMAGGLAHDFNNLLTTIIGHAALAREQMPGESRARAHLTNCLAASDKAAKLIRQLAAYTGRSYHSLGAVNLSHLVREMREELQRSAPVPVELRFSLAEDLPEIRADMAEVREVVWNLAANAVDAVAGTKGIVEIATAVCEISASDLREVAEDEELSPGKYVRLAVVDNGCGMTAEVAQNAFEPFFTTKFTGRGLGLSAVQGIVRAHRGAIRVHTGVGSGTKVEVLFPSGEPEE